jgi:hypothetical protein
MTPTKGAESFLFRAVSTPSHSSIMLGSGGTRDIPKQSYRSQKDISPVDISTGMAVVFELPW